MKPFHLPAASLLLALLLLPAHASACEFNYDEAWKTWHGDCALTIDPRGPKIRDLIVVGRAPYTLKIPDLLIDKLKFRLFGDQLEVYADIANVGTGGSPVTTVVLNVTTFDPATPNLSTTRALPAATVPTLASMATQRVFVGTVLVDHSLHDVDVVVSGMVDPVTTAQPVRGSVYELLESNNPVMHLCRVYGPAPNVNVQPCN